MSPTLQTPPLLFVLFYFMILVIELIEFKLSSFSVKRKCWSYPSVAFVMAKLLFLFCRIRLLVGEIGGEEELKLTD